MFYVPVAADGDGAWITGAATPATSRETVTPISTDPRTACITAAGWVFFAQRFADQISTAIAALP